MRSELSAALRRPVVAGVVVLLAYGALALLMDPRGYLGTDTGGKVATLEAMSVGGGLDPDIGYWAERWDPDGTVHPLFFTSRIGDQWVNVTTLPMIYAALPLYELGGYRLALLLPMGGAVAAAFAARAIARRVAPTEAWPAFWITALASPIAIYALDLWEHTIGVALMAWGIVAALDWVERRRPMSGLLSGLAFGAAFTLRTEAGVYALVTVAVVGVLMLSERRWRPAVVGGIGFGAGVLGAVGLNAGLEARVFVETTRTARSASAARRGLESIPTRLEEGLVTTTAISPSRVTVVVALGIVYGAGVVLLAWWAASERDERRRVVALLAALLGGILLLRFAMGPGFVPGLVPAAPFVAVALALGWRHRTTRALTLLAVAALPMVWAFQFLGGARPQWGGRYLLTSGLVLGAIGIALSGGLGWVRRWFVAAAIAVTAFGLVWQSERTHSIASAREALEAREETVLVSRNAFFLRELGPSFRDRQWLTLGRERDLPTLERVLEGAGIDDLALVQSDGRGAPPDLKGFEVVDEEDEQWLRTDFTVFRYERAAADGL